MVIVPVRIGFLLFSRHNTQLFFLFLVSGVFAGPNDCSGNMCVRDALTIFESWLTGMRGVPVDPFSFPDPRFRMQPWRHCVCANLAAPCSCFPFGVPRSFSPFPAPRTWLGTALLPQCLPRVAASVVAETAGEHSVGSSTRLSWRTLQSLHFSTWQPHFFGRYGTCSGRCGNVHLLRSTGADCFPRFFPVCADRRSLAHDVCIGERVVVAQLTAFAGKFRRRFVFQVGTRGICCFVHRFLTTIVQNLDLT